MPKKLKDAQERSKKRLEKNKIHNIIELIRKLSESYFVKSSTKTTLNLGSVI